MVHKQVLVQHLRVVRRRSLSLVGFVAFASPIAFLSEQYGIGMKEGKYMFPGDYVLSSSPLLSMHRVDADGSLVSSDATRPTVGPVVAVFEGRP